jgi:hypothetical protein
MRKDVKKGRRLVAVNAAHTPLRGTFSRQPVRTLVKWAYLNRSAVKKPSIRRQGAVRKTGVSGCRESGVVGKVEDHPITFRRLPQPTTAYHSLPWPTERLPSRRCPYLTVAAPLEGGGQKDGGPNRSQ